MNYRSHVARLRAAHGIRIIMTKRRDNDVDDLPEDGLSEYLVQ